MTGPVRVDREDGRTLRSGFLDHAVRTPDALALQIGRRAWTYGELDMAARRWAGVLLAALNESPTRVGVLGYRSQVSYTGALAALFAGATFVPLNPSFPPARTEPMIQLADLDAIIVERRHLEYLRSLPHTIDDRCLLLIPDGEASAGLAPRVLDRRDVDDIEPLVKLPPASPFEIAYLLFTSGSTGVPKGVPVMHSNVVHFLDVMQDRYQLSAGDRLSQTFDQTFDLSVFDMFMAWQVRASVHVLSPIDLVAPASFINRHELTVWFSVPSIPALMRKKSLLKAAALPTLRWSLFCGEPLPRATAEEWQAAAPGSVVENLYGPTELTIACFVYRWDPRRSPSECVGGLVPIGRPYPGLGAIVVREDRSPVPDGEPGELLVCGPQTVPGYWRAREKTEERFIRVPVHMSTAEPDVRFYATGDRVIRDGEGNYAYLGRTDQQVKVLGYRVELGEIETVIRDIAGVVEAIAIGWPVQDGVAQGIVVFASGTDLSSEAIRDEARNQLPKYMAPATVTIIDRMPLNANGKIDRNALRDQLFPEEPDH